MAALNKTLLIGNLGRDPEIRKTQGGTSVASFSLATTEKFSDRSGNRQEKTEWHNIIIWGNLAELAGKYLKKGSLVYLEGKLQTSSWEDKNGGGKKYKTEIVVSLMQFLGSRDAAPVVEKETLPVYDLNGEVVPPGLDDELPF